MGKEILSMAGLPRLVAVALAADFGSTLFNTVLPDGGLPAWIFSGRSLGASTNDYDVYVFDGNGSVVSASTDVQNGQNDPYELLPTLEVGQRVAVVKYSGADRFLHLDTGRGILEVSTPGAVHGHNASGATNAFSVAATWVRTPPAPFSGGQSTPSTLQLGWSATHVLQHRCSPPRRATSTSTGE
jgi:hypothetical protein